MHLFLTLVLLPIHSYQMSEPTGGYLMNQVRRLSSNIQLIFAINFAKSLD